MVTGLPTGLAIAGATPMIGVTGLFDLCPIPGGAFLPASLETLWISPFSVGFATFGVATDAAGFGALPFMIPPGAPLAGIQFSYQFPIPDALAPLGVCLTDGETVTSGFFL